MLRSLSDPSILIARLLVLLVAFTIHELAHAVTADKLGDPTPRRMGRITLNPLAHLDPIGTLALLFAGFGWAKPVMVQPLYMRGNPRRSMGIVAAAGPISNVIMAALAALVFRLGFVSFALNTNGFLPSLDLLLSEFIWINLILAFFNLIPVPPLDGSKILAALLPPEMAHYLQPLEQYGFIILMALIFLPLGILDFLVGRPAISLLRILIG